MRACVQRSTVGWMIKSSSVIALMCVRAVIYCKSCTQEERRVTPTVKENTHRLHSIACVYNVIHEESPEKDSRYDKSNTVIYSRGLNEFESCSLISPQ